MSAHYPVPQPVRPPVRVPGPRVNWTVFLPAAPAADVQLPSLIMAPMAPPQGPRL